MTKTRPAREGDCLRDNISMSGGARADIYLESVRPIPVSGRVDDERPLIIVRLDVQLPGANGRCDRLSDSCVFSETLSGEKLDYQWGYPDGSYRARSEHFESELAIDALRAAEARVAELDAQLAALLTAREQMRASATARRERSLATVQVAVD